MPYVKMSQYNVHKASQKIWGVVAQIRVPCYFHVHMQSAVLCLILEHLQLW